MTLSQSALLELAAALSAGDGDQVMRRALQAMLQALIEAEATSAIGAEPCQHADSRVNWRNGHRDKTITTAAGYVEIKIPKVRSGSFFPALLAPRRRIDVALHAVMMQAYVEGVSTRCVDDLVVAMGAAGISRSEVSRICADLDVAVAAWRTRPLDAHAFPYVFLDATYCKARAGGRVVSQAVVIATGVTADGRREVLGCAVGDSETESFWSDFLRDLRERGLGGVQLVISDSHRGLVAAIGATMAGASWQRCRTHYTVNLMSITPKSAWPGVRAMLHSVFDQPDAEAVNAQFDKLTAQLATTMPAVVDHLEAARADLLAFTSFPKAIWRQIWSNNPQERLNKEIRRRTDVVGIFPNRESLIRLVGAVLAEQHDEWTEGRRYLGLDVLARSRMTLVPSTTEEVPTPAQALSA